MRRDEETLKHIEKMLRREGEKMRETICFKSEFWINEQWVPLNCSCDIVFSKDDSYGADADNRRGALALFVEEVEITLIVNDDGEFLPVERTDDALKARIERTAVSKFYRT